MDQSNFVVLVILHCSKTKSVITMFTLLGYTGVTKQNKNCYGHRHIFHYNIKTIIARDLKFTI
jgi:hypothetical protein